MSTRPGPRRCSGRRRTGHRYSTASEQPLPHWDFYVALAYFKSAIIAAGIDFRSRMGGSDDTVDQVGEATAPPIAAGLSRMKT
jgi:Predicted aminoglycoside phosphotransferase